MAQVHKSRTPKTATFNARIDPALKRDAEHTLAQMGVSISDAFRIFLRQVVLRHGLPFDVRLPNAETQLALAELDAGGGKESAS
jgi:DNA-damage-inducible protein J